MRNFGRKDAPLGLAIAIGALAWLFSHVADGLQGMLIVAYDTHLEQTQSGPVVNMTLRNESISQAVVDGSFSLICPPLPNDQGGGVPSKCLRAAYAGLSEYAVAFRQAPWNITLRPSSRDTQADIDSFSLPAGAALELQAALVSGDSQPQLYYNAGAGGAGVQAPQLFSSIWPVWLIRNFYWILGSLGLLLLVVVGVWAFLRAPQEETGQGTNS